MAGELRANQINLSSDLESDDGALRLAAAVAGDGLSGGAGSALSVNVDGLSIETSGDALQVKASGITDAMLAGSISFSKLSDSANIARLDQAETVAAVWGFGSYLPTATANPSSDNELARKAYVDSVASGLYWKDAVVAATTAAGTLASDFEDGDLIDGVTLVAGERILIKDQTDASENGIYIVQTSGAPSRASDADVSGELVSAAVFVKEGTVNADMGFTCTVDDAFVLDTDSCAWVQFTGLGQITAGAALTKSGNTLDVSVDDSSIEVSGDALQVKALGITNAMLAGSIANAKLSNSSVTVTAGDGLKTGGSVALGASVTLDLDLNELTAASVDVANDSIAIIDANDSNGSKKESISNLVDGMVSGSTGIAASSGVIDLASGSAGDGLGFSSGVLSVNVDNSSIETSADTLQVKASGITNAMLAGSIASSKLADEPYLDTGAPCKGWIKLSNAGSASQNVTISGETWTAVSGTAGANQYDVSGGTAALSAASLASRINSDSSLVYAEHETGSALIRLVGRSVNGTQETLGGTQAATYSNDGADRLYSGSAAADKKVLAGEYLVRSGDATNASEGIAIAAFPDASLSTPPELVSVALRDANGIFKSLIAVKVIIRRDASSQFYQLVVEDDASVLATNDTISFMMQKS